MLGNITAEDRKKYLEKARIAKEEKREAGKGLITDYADENYWRELASKVGFRLANKYNPASETKYIKRLLKHLDLDIDWWKDQTGFKKVSDFSVANPKFTAYAVQGIILESYFGENK